MTTTTTRKIAIGDVVARGEARADDDQLAHEDRERGHARQREGGAEEERPREGGVREEPPDRVHVAAAVPVERVARDEEHEGLRHPVVEDVEERGVGPDRPAEAEAERDDPDVLDAVVAEQPLEVPLGRG